MTKNSSGKKSRSGARDYQALRAIEQAELRAQVAAQDARHAAEAAQIRREHDQLINDERQRAALERLERQAQRLEQTENTPPAADSGFWRDRVQPAAAPAADVDVADMTMAEYAQLRGQLGIAGRGEENISRRPGQTQSSGRGMFDGLPGYVDPRQSKRVFDSQLPDQRRAVPPGYVRGQTEERYA